MKILNTLPPIEIYQKAVEKFGVDFYKGFIFTVGDTIYSYTKVLPDVLVHEAVHVKQQTTIKGGWKEWWKRYFEDESFRLSQEIEAYRIQYQWICKNIKDRNKRNDHLVFYAKCLSGEMYGKIISFHEACGLIKKMTN